VAGELPEELPEEEEADPQEEVAVLHLLVNSAKLCLTLRQRIQMN